MKLIISALLTALLTIIFRYLDNKGILGKIGNKWLREGLVGIVFGLSAIYATEFGSISIGGAAMNARDAAPLCAGLFFGGFSGIVAGVIGGVERFFCVYWGGAHFTKVACAIACILAGLFAAFLRKFVFDNKRPKPIYCVIIGLISETIHMFLIFITNQKDLDVAYTYAKACTIPMITVNILALFIAFLVIELMERKKLSLGVRKKKTILAYFQFGLLSLVIAAAAFTVYITIIVQTNIAEKSTERVCKTNLEAAVAEVEGFHERRPDANIIDIAKFVGDGYVVGETGEIWVLNLDKVVVTEGEFLGEDLNYLLKGQTQKKLFKTSFEGDEYYLEFIFGSGYILMASIIAQDALYLTNVSIYVTILLEILIFAVLFLFITLEMKQLVSRHIDEVNENMDAITAGELDRVVNVRNSIEFDMLSDSVNSMVDHLKELIEEEKNRIAKELEFARNVQLSSLTTEFDLSEAVDLFARTLPAREVGGDFYDAYKLDDTHIGILIADVSGKGIPAAMFMMRARSTIKALAQAKLPISEVLTRANGTFCENNAGEMFITAWMAILDLKTGDIEFVNAGHNPPIIKRDGTFSYLQSKRNLVLAAMEGYAYKSGSFTIKPGDEIFLYTDGVTEAININEELYGEARLLSFITEHDHDISAEQLCSDVLQSVNDYAGEEVEQFDDITMLSLKFLKYL